MNKHACQHKTHNPHNTASASASSPLPLIFCYSFFVSTISHSSLFHYYINMGCSVRNKDKHVRTNRKPPSLKPDSNPKSDSCSQTIMPSDSSLNPNPNPNLAPTGWGFCTEDELQELLLKNMEMVYREVVSKLVSLGYDEEEAVKAVLHNGHCYGGMDVLENIMTNSLAYLENNCKLEGENGFGFGSDRGGFSDMRQLEAFSLAAMVCLLQQLRPNLSRGDALWCLLVSEFHVGKASSIKIPANGSCCCSSAAGAANAHCDNAAPSLCRFHGYWAFENGECMDLPITGVLPCGTAVNLELQREIEFPQKFNLSPTLKFFLKRNVAMGAAWYRVNSKKLQLLAKASSGGGSTVSTAVSGAGVLGDRSGDSHNPNAQDAWNSMLIKFRELNLDEYMESLAAGDKKNEMLLTLIHQVKELEKEAKVQKDWALQKAVQAARTLSGNLTELKTLRILREETQRLKKGKQALEDTTMKRLSEMEEVLRKASGQVDQANAVVKKLEIENAEIKAELEAAKLSSSESVKSYMQVTKREKKCLKKLIAWEKQKDKMQQEISDEKQKILAIEEELAQIRQCTKEAEVKGREELKAKEVALALIEEERRSKEAAEAENKRNLKALRLKIEIDFQRRKDDLQRLEQELSRLKASAQSAVLRYRSNTSLASESEGAKPQRETIAKLLQELDNLEDFSDNEVKGARECIICMEGEVSIMFLPCAHQVMCASCGEEYGRKRKAACPCCRVLIEQRIRVFGACS